MERTRSLCFLAVVLAALGGCLALGQDGLCAGAVAVQKRINCHPQPSASQEACEARGCTWCVTNVVNAPWCFFPEDSPHGYSLGGNVESTDKGWRVTLNRRQALSLFGNDISPVVLEVEFQTKDRLRFRLYDPSSRRFEVPLKIDSPGVSAEEASYDVEFVDDTSRFRVKRKSTGTVLWDSPLVDLLFSNQYLQITTTVPSTSVYGFGEHEHPSFKHSMDFITYGMFSRDQAPKYLADKNGEKLKNQAIPNVLLMFQPFANLYGVHPFYMYVSLSPNPSLTFRTIGGILDFYVFLGPTPENVIQQYTEDPFVTKDEEPGTYRPYDLGEEMGVWVNNSDGVTPAVGKALAPGDSVFPDFTNPRTVEWWTQMCLEFKDVLDYDGIWIDMNEPSNFLRGQYPGCAVNDINNPPYVPIIWPSSAPTTENQQVLNGSGIEPLAASAHKAKLCLKAQVDHMMLLVTFLIINDLVAFLHSAVQQATGKRAFVLSRSTFVGSGKHGGHWLGDNLSQWKDMHQSIIGILEFNLFGIPYVGADICGFSYNTTYELCLRWMQLGSFYPFARNHNEEGNKGARSVDVYFPEASWFDYYTGRKLPSTWKKNYATVAAPLSKIPLFIRGGYILPEQAPATTTTKSAHQFVLTLLNVLVNSRLNPFGLIIALDEQGEASGSLFWDDGDSIDTIENENYFLAKYTYSEVSSSTQEWRSAEERWCGVIAEALQVGTQDAGWRNRARDPTGNPGAVKSSPVVGQEVLAGSWAKPKEERGSLKQM
ncbi:sucrase-isomaltase, intestinal-like [Pterocles gutturalis]